MFFYYCILCLCIVTVVLLLYLAIWATISLHTLHFLSNATVEVTVFTEATNVNHADGISRHRLTPHDVHTLHYKL